MSATRRRVAIASWWLLLAVLAVFVQRTLVVGSDLREFMPAPHDAEQKLLLDEIGNGPASRLLLLAIHSDDAAHATALSRQLKSALQADPAFSRVLNGSESLADLDPALLDYRYLLSPTLDTHRFDAAYLREQFEQRIEDLGSPAASLLDALLPRDPTLETLVLAERWTPRHAPALRDGVWYSDAGALLVAATRAAAFDTDAQAAAIVALRAHYAALPHAAQAQLIVSGPGYIAAQVARSTRAEAEALSLAGTLGFALLLLLAYRSAGVLVLVALPLLSGALCGLLALELAQGSVHGITLAFGFTLLGVAQEYPLRVFSHRRAGVDPRTSVREVWPLLRLAIVSACIAYLAFMASGVRGLQQLAIFTIVGLLVAGAATRWVLPGLLAPRWRDTADSRVLEALRHASAGRRWPGWIPAALCATALAVVVFSPAPWWQNDLAALAPAPADALAREARLRQALGAPDVRYLLVLHADSAQGVLELSERIAPSTAAWIAQGAVGDVELPSRYLPSLRTQRTRQARLPDRVHLQAALDAALQGLPFQPGLFEPFVRDVEHARSLAPLTPARFADSAIGARLQGMLAQREGRWYGLATLDDVRDAGAIASIATATHGAARLLDLKAASAELVAAYRTRILQALGAALLLLAASVALAFRNARRAWHVIAPMSLATLLVLAVLRGAGEPLSLFHLVALTLAAGLGLHYALFFERPVRDAAEGRRTLHATLVCVASAVWVFGLLACSRIPVLHAIGFTVALGVVLHFILSIHMAPARDA